MTASPEIDRRRHVRFKVPPMYTSVTARHTDGDEIREFLGHAYDVSASGVRIELDEPLALGASVALCIELPCSDEHVYACADVVWIADPEDDPGPRRIALRFTEFLSPADEEQLVSYLGRGHLRQAA